MIWPVKARVWAASVAGGAAAAAAVATKGGGEGRSGTSSMPMRNDLVDGRKTKT